MPTFRAVVPTVRAVASTTVQYVSAAACSTIQELEAELARLDAEIELLQRKRVAIIARKEDRIRSQEWIRANGVTRENTHMQDPDDPVFVTSQEFAQMMESRDGHKPFAVSWTGIVYRTEDMLRGMPTGGVGLVEDIP